MKAPEESAAKRAPRRRSAAAGGADDVVPVGNASRKRSVRADTNPTDMQLAQLTDAVERLTTLITAGRSAPGATAGLGAWGDDHAGSAAALASLKEQYAALERARAAELDELKRVKKKYSRLKQEIETLRTERAVEAATSKAAAANAKLKPRPRRLLAMAKHLPFIGYLQKRAGLQRQMNAIRTSELFDADWYLAAYPDVAAAGLNPALHYLQKGWLETRDPGPDFNTSRYLKANPDIARAGMNPLLHYIEHGREEGRAIGVATARKFQRVTESFTPPAPCVQFPVAEPKPLRWRRSAVLARLSDGKVELGGHAIGCAISGALADALERFGALTGLNTALPLDASDADVQPLPTLRDAWFVQDNLLRLHWDPQPGACSVVRCLQWQSGQELSLAGEGLVTGNPAFLDLELASPFKPLLILFATPEGRLVGGEVLAFPSLARGGLHHGELARLAAMTGPRERKDLPARSRDFEARLLALLAREKRPLLRAIRIGLDGADGTGPLFQPDVQAWLAQVMHIGLESPAPPAGREPTVAQFLIEQAGPLSPPRIGAMREEATATLALPHDCCPSLEILLADAASSDQPRAAGPIPLSLACETSDPNQPYVFASLPPGSGAALLEGLAQSNPDWPWLDHGVVGHEALLGAIRTSRSRPLADVELLEPSAQHGLSEGGGGAAGTVTVVVEPAAWDPDAFAAALASLASQTCADQLALCCIGQPHPIAQAAISRVLGLSPIVVGSLDDAASAMADGYVLHLGAGIILHDRRTIAHLALLAGRETVAGASCAILVPSRRGREWVHAIHSAGMAAGTAGLVDLAPEATNLWNIVMPMAQLPQALWLTRRERLAGLNQDGATILLLSTRVTASRFADLPGQPEALKPPLADAEQALQISWCLA